MKLIKCYHFITRKRQLSFNKYILLFIILLGINFNTGAQSLSYNWEDADFSVPVISPEFLNEDAVVLSQIDVLSVVNDQAYIPINLGNNKYYSLNTFKKVRIKILTLNGLEKYANLEFSIKSGSKLKILDGRVLKANKKEYLIDSTDVVEVNAKNASYAQNPDDLFNKKIKIAFPNVETGDIIEYVYSYQTPDFSPYNLSGEIVLNADVPILNSEYYVVVPNDMDIFYNLFNNFQKPATSVENNNVYCRFQQVNIPSLQNSEFSNLQSQVPFFYYQVLPKDIKNFRMSWDFIYKMTYVYSFSDIKLNNTNNKYYNKWKKNLLKNYEDSTKTSKFTVLFNDIRDNMIVRNSLPEYDSYNSLGYYLKEGYINKANLLKLYKKIFDDLEMDYYFCYARNKYKDPINFEEIRKDEATDLFFIFTDEKNKFRYVYANDEIQKFEIDELPNNILGTDAMMMRHTIDKSKPFMLEIPELAEYIRNFFKLKYNLKIDSKIITLPLGTVNKNFIIQQNNLNFNFGDSLCHFKNNIRLSGALSTKYRTFFNQMEKDQDFFMYYSTVASELFKNSNKDTAYIESFKHNYPYEFKIVSIGKIKNCIDEIDTNLYTISLKDVITHDILNLPDEERIFNIVPEFIYSDFIQLFIKFDKPVKLVNPETFSIVVDNEYGSYSLMAKGINETTILVNSQYSIKTKVLPADKCDKLLEINKALKKSTLKKLIVQKL